MPPRRSSAVTLLAVANMVLGTLGILCACANGVMMAFMSSISDNEPDPLLQSLGEFWNFLLRNVPGYLQIEIALAIFHLAISILAIIAGVGLLSLRTWGRFLALTYGMTMILVEGSYLLYFFAFVYPVLNRAEGRPAGGDGLLNSGSIEAIGSFIVLVYAMVLVIVLFLPGISAEFSGKADSYLADDGW